MAALAKPQAFNENTAGLGSPKVKGSTTIYKGAMVGITAAGYAQPFATGNFFAGHALETVDNSAVPMVPYVSRCDVAFIGRRCLSSHQQPSQISGIQCGQRRTIIPT